VKGDDDKSIITFLWPADVKGSKMLTHTHKKDDDDQWLFLPALKRVKRISSRSKTGSFMGSEFSYEDLSSQEIEKYKYKWLRDEKFNGEDHWVIERFPIDSKSGYKRQVVWLSKKILHASKVDYYDRKNELLKTATFHDYVKLKRWWRPGSIKMINHQTKKSSILKWKNRKIGLKFSAKDFHKNSLKE
ncbi:MAG: outer membrane lipoprotein-sorting protein, partial [Bdellovibrionales bacterium]|nr:outer membrane lipoprotein-sorting protein [Bdellovibrionales bacterium]